MAKITVQQPATRVVPQRVQEVVQTAVTSAPNKTASTVQDQGTQPPDPSETVSGQRMQAYQDPQDTQVRAALDQLRAQFPNLTQEQWISYLSTPPQQKVEQQANQAAQETVEKATPQEKAAAEKASQASGAHDHRKYTPEEVLMYRELKTALPKEAQADLKKLLLDGKMLEEDANHSGNLLHYLHGLLKVDFSGVPVFEGANKESILQQVVHDLAHPESIEQRWGTSCLGGATEYDMAKSHPAEYARVISELYTSSESNPLLASLGFDASSPILQGICHQMEERAREGKFSEGFVATTYEFIQDKFPNVSDKTKSFMHNVLDAAKTFYLDKDPLKAASMIVQNKKENSDAEVQDELNKMVNTLASDTSTIFQVTSASEGDQIGSLAKNGIYGNQGYYTGPGVLDAIKKAMADGKEPYAALKVDDAAHMMVIKEIKDGKITLHDPEGGEQTINEQDFEKKFLAVFLPDGYQGNLTHLREDDTTPIWGRSASRLSTMR